MYEELLEPLKLDETNIAAPDTSQVLHAIDSLILVNNTLVTTMQDEIFECQLLHVTSVALKATRWRMMCGRVHECGRLMAKD